MQGIPFFHYKCLCDDVEKIHQQSEILKLPAEHRDMITSQKENLNRVYDDYEMTLKKISLIIKEYRDQQNAIRRLMIQHKRYKRLVKAPIKKWQQETTRLTIKISR